MHEPVHVVLYGESLCPSCRYFVENIVAPMFDQGLNEHLFRFRYLAYGNARNQSDVRRRQPWHSRQARPAQQHVGAGNPADSASSIVGPHTGPVHKSHGGNRHLVE